MAKLLEKTGLSCFYEMPATPDWYSNGSVDRKADRGRTTSPEESIKFKISQCRGGFVRNYKAASHEPTATL